jgi:hypothetical protein
MSATFNPADPRQTETPSNSCLTKSTTVLGCRTLIAMRGFARSARPATVRGSAVDAEPDLDDVLAALLDEVLGAVEGIHEPCARMFPDVAVLPRFLGDDGVARRGQPCADDGVRGEIGGRHRALVRLQRRGCDGIRAHRQDGVTRLFREVGREGELRLEGRVFRPLHRVLFRRVSSARG